MKFEKETFLVSWGDKALATTNRNNRSSKSMFGEIEEAASHADILKTATRIVLFDFISRLVSSKEASSKF